MTNIVFDLRGKELGQFIRSVGGMVHYADKLGNVHSVRVDCCSVASERSIYRNDTEGLEEAEGERQRNRRP